MSKARKHLRPCPALGRDITPAECGEGRGSAYQCPAECPFFPFTPANYEKHGEIEHRLIQKAFARAAKELPPFERESLLAANGDSEEDGKAELHYHARFAWLFHGRRDAEGRALSEGWLADKTGGLTNDERVLLAGLNEMRPALIEIHRIIDERTIEGVDLLAGQQLHIIDYGAAASAIRYGVLFSWVYPMRHYDRISGSALFVPEVADIPPEEVVREIIRHLGGPTDSAGERTWLSEHFARVAAALGAMQIARWQDVMATMDARYIKTDYRLRKGAPLAVRLAGLPGVEEEPLTEEEAAQGFDRAYVWLSEDPTPDPHQLALPLAGPPTFGAAPAIIGRTLVGRERARVEAMTGARHQELRTRFEKLAAGRLEFLGERSDDLGARSAGTTREFDPALVPPRLREKPQQIVFSTQRFAPAEDGGPPDLVEIFRQSYAAFADEPLPALEGQTPRAAAADPALRPRLVALMKSHICGADRRRREESLDLDLNPLLAEIGLQELISEPPPLGFAEAELEDELDEEADDPLEFIESMGRRLDPRPMRPPLDEHELAKRLRAMHERYSTPEEAAEAINDTFPNLLDLIYEAMHDALNKNEEPLLEVLVMRACHVLGPPWAPKRALESERIVRSLAREYAQAARIMAAGFKSSAAFEHWVCDSPQPIVMQDLSATLFTVIDKLRRKERPRDEYVLLILACIKAVVAELSRVG